eukprot:gene24374-9984_t
MLPVTVAHSSPKLLNKVQPTSEPAACEPATKTLPTREDTSAQAPECEGRKALPESAAIEAGPESGDEESLELSVHKQFQAIDFSALTLEEFKALPLTQRECKIWAANGGWKIDGYEAGASEEDSRQQSGLQHVSNPNSIHPSIHFQASPKATIGRPACFKCKFCENMSSVVKDFLAYKRLDYVIFVPTPGLNNNVSLGRVEAVNKKSISVVVASGKRFKVQDKGHIKMAPEAPQALLNSLPLSLPFSPPL